MLGLYGWLEMKPLPRQIACLDRKLCAYKAIEAYALLCGLHHKTAMQKRWNADFKSAAIRAL